MLECTSQQGWNRVGKALLSKREKWTRPGRWNSGYSYSHILSIFLGFKPDAGWLGFVATILQDYHHVAPLHLPGLDPWEGDECPSAPKKPLYRALVRIGQWTINYWEYVNDYANNWWWILFLSWQFWDNSPFQVHCHMQHLYLFAHIVQNILSWNEQNHFKFIYSFWFIYHFPVSNAVYTLRSGWLWLWLAHSLMLSQNHWNLGWNLGRMILL